MGITGSSAFGGDKSLRVDQQQKRLDKEEHELEEDQGEHDTLLDNEAMNAYSR